MKRKVFEQLVNWKNKSKRMPLIVNGARQVGKTYILKEFGAKCFTQSLRKFGNKSAGKFIFREGYNS